VRDYELIVLFGIDRVPELASTHIDAVTDRISAHGGEVNSVNSWGRRKFAYPIKGQREGHYALVKFCMDPEHLAELHESLRITEDITRYLITREDEEIAAAEAAAISEGDA
jgi:small subunit ribosomal protein S6